MFEDIKTLQKTVKFMRKHGVLKYKTKEFEICLAQSAMFPVEHKGKTEEKTEDDGLNPPYSAEAMLLWSAPGYNPPEDSEERQ